MRREWLWLEDQPETVADFKAAIDTNVIVRQFMTPSELVRGLLELPPDRRECLGLILDVMLIHNPQLTCPPEWHGGDKAIYFKTRRGYDAGLVLYENFMLPNPEVPRPLVQPPPVVFLTVVKHDLQELEKRFVSIKQRWAKEHGVEVDDAQVAWARKWDANGKGLLGILRSWEGSTP